MRTSRSIVYFAYLGEEGTDDALIRQRLAFMGRQLGWLSDLVGTTGERDRVLVPYVAPRAWDAEVGGAVRGHGFRIDAASVAADRRNTFEYPGFLAMKALAGMLAPQDLIYYCHSKGIVHLDEGKMGLFRLHTHVGLTADLAQFAADPSLTRAALFPYRFGWCWYNFFWIKAGYMAGRIVAPSADRHEFEALIGTRGDKEGYRGVLPLIDRLPFAATGIAVQPWYRPEETTSPALTATYDRYAGMDRPPARPLRAADEEPATTPAPG